MDNFFITDRGVRLRSDRLAFDRASVRTIDAAGRMHVAITNISKAAVNPYRGSEIPNYKNLGLDADSIYFLLRDPQELERAADTFNNIPLLSKHIPVTVEAPQKEYVVGSTGTDAVYQEPYLKNSLVAWDAVAIAGIESREQCELSASYWYDADMTPGVYQGVRYDGVMRNIRGNHIAFVEVGRAGPDVVVSDSQPMDMEIPKMKYSRKAIAVAGALKAYLRPKLAQDAAIGDLGAIVRGVKGATYAQDKARIQKAVEDRVNGKLAADADLADLANLLDAFDDKGQPDDITADDDFGAPNPNIGEDDDGDLGEKLRTLLSGKMGEEEIAQLIERIKTPPAQDNPPPTPGTPSPPAGVEKTAMDAAIKKAEKRAEQATIARMNAIRVAENEVRSLIGDVAAMDSAEDIYRLALNAEEVDTTGVDPSAYRSMVQMLKKHACAPKTPRVAMDSAAEKSFAERYPYALKIKRS